MTNLYGSGFAVQCWVGGSSKERVEVVANMSRMCNITLYLRSHSKFRVMRGLQVHETKYQI